MATGERIGRPAALPAPPLLLPVAAIGMSLGAAVLVLAVTPADLLGYDYSAYVAAARRLVEGLPLYDPAVDVAGGFAIYLYPPPFALAMVPFLALPPAAGPWVWAGLLYAAFVIGCLAMPVGHTARWLTVLTMGASWPVVYSLKLGQVGPLLVLTLALGWRWLDRPLLLAGSIAAGTLVKLQPVALLGWAVVTRRWRAALATVAILVLAGLLITPLVGLGAWSDYAALLARVNQPVTTPHNFTPGAVIRELGVPETLAMVVQSISTLAAIGLTAWTWFRRAPAVGYLSTVVAGQLVSPLLWDHYAAVLALPVAFLLDRRRWWILVIPIALSLPLLFIVPPIVYPIVFWAALIGSALQREEPHDEP
jgi:alpha-1,2-mannosyltransferase